MRRLAMILAAAILSAGLAYAADDAPKRPAWCQAGYVCVKTIEIAQDAEYHLDLRQEVAKYKSRASRFGFTIGFGLGVGGVVDDQFNVRWVPVGGAMIVYGIRFP